MRVVFACDHAGARLREAVLAALKELGVEAIDIGAQSEDIPTDYPDFANEAVRWLKEGQAEMAILVCGSGVGMAIAANRHLGVRAVVCSEAYSAEMARRHNDANVLCMGARVVGPGVARQLVRVFVQTPFEEGRHRERITKIDRSAGWSGRGCKKDEEG
ncbi:MAG: ribose 5-phosphate isomerase B [Sandaracinaceae bacterium]|nr:ribose 5-phosphate isomerase B [Sandaracinaceae bacterium]